MATHIELVCENCGKVLKVHKSRSGQTGKCARCKKPVTIPSDTTSGASNTSSQIAAETVAKLEQIYMEGAEPIVSSPMPARYSPDEGEPGQQCPKCGELNSVDALNCQYCGSGFHKKVSLPKRVKKARVEKSSAHKKQQALLKKTQKRKFKKNNSRFSYFAFLLGLTLGVILGLILGPGYLRILPAKESIMSVLPWLAQPPDKIDTAVSDTKDNKTPNTNIGHDTPQTNATQSTSQQQVDDYLKSQVEEAVTDVEIYLYALRKHHRSLKQQMHVLNKEYPGLYLPGIEKIIDVEENARNWDRGLQQRIDFAKNVLQKERWDLLDNAHKNLKKYRKLDPKTHSVVMRMQRATQKLALELQKYGKRTTQSPSVNTKFMGSWYFALQQQIANVKQMLQSSSIQRGVVEERLQVSVKKIQGYAKDIDNAAQIIQKVRQQKDIRKWIKWRTANANTHSQLKQAKILQEFLEMEKFELPMHDELAQLKLKTENLQQAIAKKQETKSAIKEVLKTLQAIHRKYEENYQVFNSAVVNFQFWNPAK